MWSAGSLPQLRRLRLGGGTGLAEACSRHSFQVRIRVSESVGSVLGVEVAAVLGAGRVDITGWHSVWSVPSLHVLTCPGTCLVVQLNVGLISMCWDSLPFPLRKLPLNYRHTGYRLLPVWLKPTVGNMVHLTVFHLGPMKHITKC